MFHSVSSKLDIPSLEREVLDFWKKPIEVKKLRGNIDTEILLADIPALSVKHERIAVEVVKLAEKRHEELIK